MPTKTRLYFVEYARSGKYVAGAKKKISEKINLFEWAVNTAMVHD